MRRERQQLDPTLEMRLLEQAATPALAGHDEWISRRDLGAVGGHRQRHARTNVRHDLAASVARRPDDDLGVELVGQIGESMPPGSRRVVRQSWIVGHVQPAHAVRGKDSRGRCAPGTDHCGLERPTRRARDPSRHRQHLERQHGRSSGGMLDKGEDHAQSNRRRRKSSTT